MPSSKANSPGKPADATGDELPLARGPATPPHSQGADHASESSAFHRGNGNDDPSTDDPDDGTDDDTVEPDVPPTGGNGSVDDGTQDDDPDDDQPDDVDPDDPVAPGHVPSGLLLHAPVLPTPGGPGGRATPADPASPPTLDGFVDHLFERFDGDGDSAITLDEMLAVLDPSLAHAGFDKAIAKVFAAIDTDADEALSHDEVAAVIAALDDGHHPGGRGHDDALHGSTIALVGAALTVPLEG